MSLRLPWLGNVEADELGVIAAVIMLCCLAAGLVGHCMGCSDPTAPTQYPMWPLCAKPPEDGDDDVENQKPSKQKSSAEEPQAGVAKEKDPDANSRPKRKSSVKIDPAKQASDAKKHAEKKKAAQEKAAQKNAGFGRAAPKSPPKAAPKSGTKKNPPKKKAAAESDETYEGEGSGL